MCGQLSSMCVCVSVMCEPCWEQIGHVLDTGRSSSTSPLLCRSAAVGKRLVISLCLKMRRWSGHDLEPVFHLGMEVVRCRAPSMRLLCRHYIARIIVIEPRMHHCS